MEVARQPTPCFDYHPKRTRGWQWRRRRGPAKVGAYRGWGSKASAALMPLRTAPSSVAG